MIVTYTKNLRKKSMMQKFKLKANKKKYKIQFTVFLVTKTIQKKKNNN